MIAHDAAAAGLLSQFRRTRAAARRLQVPAGLRARGAQPTGETLPQRALEYPPGVRSKPLAIGLLFIAAAVGAGAFGAHGLRGHLTPAALDQWETAARYLALGGVALAMVGIAGQSVSRRAGALAPLLVAVGTAVFSVTVGLLALGAPRWLGAVTPLGGLALIAGLVVAAAGAWPDSPGRGPSA